MVYIIGAGAVTGLLVAIFILIPTNRLRFLALAVLMAVTAALTFGPRALIDPIQLPVAIIEGVPSLGNEAMFGTAETRRIEAELETLAEERARLEEERAAIGALFDELSSRVETVGGGAISVGPDAPQIVDDGLLNSQIQGLNVRRAFLEAEIGAVEADLSQAADALQQAESEAVPNPYVDGTASVAHDLPLSMHFRDNIHVRLVVAPRTLGRPATDILMDPAGTELDIVVRQFDETVLMRANLHSTDFDIEQTLQQEQRALPDREMNWGWIVAPRRGGEDLRLTFSLEVVIGAGDTKQFSSFPPIAATINVTTSLWDRALLALAEVETAEAVLSGLIATFLTLAGLAAKFVAGRSKANEEDEEDGDDETPSINVFVHDGDPPQAGATPSPQNAVP